VKINFTVNFNCDRYIPVEDAFVLVREFEATDKTDFVEICTDVQVQGIYCEYAWIKQKYINYRILCQEFWPEDIMVNGEETACDVIKIVFSDGSKKSIYFDITQFVQDYFDQFVIK